MAGQDRLVFKAYDPGGGVWEKSLPLQDLTSISDQTILHSVPFNDHWLVWIPSQLELLLFDKKLRLTKRIPVAVPDRLCQISFDLLERINRERTGEPCRRICEQHAGEPLHAIPAGISLADNRIGLYYVVSLLGDFNPTKTDQPQVDVETFTECIQLSANKYELLPDTEVYPDAFVSGLHGEPGLALGRKWVASESRWVYSRFPRGNR